MVLCPLLSNPVNGKVVLTNGREVGSIASYICDEGFRLRDTDVISRVCESNEMWTNTEPQCIRKCKGEGLVGGASLTCIMQESFMSS